MAQGQVKGLQKAKASGARHAAKAAAQPKKGRRYAAPKKKDAMKHAVMHQQLSAKINRSIEQQVASAASSGKLTIMRNVAMEGNATKEKDAKGKKS